MNNVGSIIYIVIQLSYTSVSIPRSQPVPVFRKPEPKVVEVEDGPLWKKRKVEVTDKELVYREGQMSYDGHNYK